VRCLSYDITQCLEEPIHFVVERDDLLRSLFPRGVSR
jgi:hypothetical protein